MNFTHKDLHSKLRSASKIKKIRPLTKKDRKFILDRYLNELALKLQRFDIRKGSNLEFDLNFAVATLSCFDKQPREVRSEFDDDIFTDLEADTLKKLQNIHISVNNIKDYNNIKNIQDCLNITEGTRELRIS